MKHKLFIALGLSFFGAAAIAKSLPPASIQSLGCDQATNRCSLTLNLEQFGPAECTANQISWQSDSEQGKLALALLSSAMMTNHLVEIELASVCYNAMPELASFNVLAQSAK